MCSFKREIFYCCRNKVCCSSYTTGPIAGSIIGWRAPVHVFVFCTINFCEMNMTPPPIFRGPDFGLKSAEIEITAWLASAYDFYARVVKDSFTTLIRFSTVKIRFLFHPFTSRKSLYVWHKLFYLQSSLF